LASVPSVDKSLKPALLDAYFKLDAFPDARMALKALKADGCKTGILSNGSPAMLKGAVEAAAIGGDLDAVLSVDALKMFKPRPEVYRLVTDQFRCVPADVTFVSSNRWDVMAGVRAGFRGIWVNRSNMPDEYQDFPPAQVLKELSALSEIDQHFRRNHKAGAIRIRGLYAHCDSPPVPQPCNRSFPLQTFRNVTRQDSKR